MNRLTLMLFGFAFVLFKAETAPADQAQWASQYVNWQLTDPSIREIWNVDQKIWIAKSNDESFWPFVWTWKGMSDGGYIGFQQRGSADDQNVRFSIWNATASEGANCRKFGGEGIGETCEIKVSIDTNKYYRTRLWKLDAEDDGQWWGGWLIEEGGNGNLVEHFIGQIKAPVAATSVAADAINNFVEYFGPSKSPCDSVPLSIVGLIPPTVNYKSGGTGDYGGYTELGVSDKARDNICSNGTEANGALIKVAPYSFPFADGAIAFMGGSSAQQELPPGTKAPTDMPDG